MQCRSRGMGVSRAAASHIHIDFMHYRRYRLPARGPPSELEIDALHAPVYAGAME